MTSRPKRPTDKSFDGEFATLGELIDDMTIKPAPSVGHELRHEG